MATSTSDGDGRHNPHSGGAERAWRRHKAADPRTDGRGRTAYDEVTETVTASLEAQQVRRCLSALTDLQRESVTLAYYGGYSYREVAELLDAKLATIKARMRDGLIRLRDCLGGAR